MREGWKDNDYLTLFDESEIAPITRSYGLDSILPGFSIFGIRGWDEFLIRDSGGRLFAIPTVPLDTKYLRPAENLFDGAVLQIDAQLSGKIKWYVTPLVFGGDPSDQNNLIWVDHGKHAELVRWWNNKYVEVLRAQKSQG